MKKLISFTLLLLAFVSIESCISIKSTSKRKAEAAKAAKKPDPKPKKDAIKPYAKVITKDAQSDEGSFYSS